MILSGLIHRAEKPNKVMWGRDKEGCNALFVPYSNNCTSMTVVFKVEHSHVLHH